MTERTPDEYFDELAEALVDGAADVPCPSAAEIDAWGAEAFRKLERQVGRICQGLHRNSPLQRMEAAHAAAAHGSIPGIEIQSVIGAAGQSTVYRAVVSESGAIGALKAYGRVPGQVSDEDRARASHEARSLNSLDHPRIVGLLGQGETSTGHPYLLLEYVDGPALELLSRPGLDARPTTIARFVHDLALAVEHAHRAGIVHRDIKPANVLVRGLGAGRGLDRACPVLIDFGLVQLSGSHARLTMTGLQAGTIAYMAPEQFDPPTFGQVGPRTDVRGVGLVLYELLVGAPAYSGTTHTELERAITRLDSLSLEPRLEGADPQLATICLRALETRPMDRYESAASLAADLDRFVRGRPLEACRPGRMSRARRWARRHRTGLAVAAIVVAASVGILVTRIEAAAREERIARVAFGALEALSEASARTRVQQAALQGARPKIIDALWPRVQQFLDSSPRRKDGATAVRLLNLFARGAGDLDRAQSSRAAMRAYELATRFGFLDPDARDEDRFEAARALSALGRATGLSGDLSVAKAHLEMATEQFDVLVGRGAFPGSSGLSFERGICWNNLGNVLSDLRDTANESAYFRALDMFREGAETDGRCGVWRVKTLSNVAYYSTSKDPLASLLLHNEAVSAAEEYVERSREARWLESAGADVWLAYELDFREGLGIALTNRAVAYSTLGRLSEARADIERALAIYEALRDALSGHREFLWSVAMAETDLAKLLLEIDRVGLQDDALRLLNGARRWYDAAERRWPDDGSLRDYSRQNRDALELARARPGADDDEVNGD